MSWSREDTDAILVCCVSQCRILMLYSAIRVSSALIQMAMSGQVIRKEGEGDLFQGCMYVFMCAG